ncbi:MAG: crossover junction endodeoxyribonuclease RuvC [Patescibacteria group bacterium]|nr:crossover junction endodeoxyribonuclease RuvC [Patescibacteria group bacterium]
MTTLSIDIGTKSGWAVRKNDGKIIFGTHVCKVEGRKEIDGLRYLRFRAMLTELKNSVGGIDQVLYEEVMRHSNTAAAHVYGGYRAVLQMWCAHHDIPCTGINVKTIKKFMTGNGNADKNAMIAAAKKRGFKTKGHDEADAIAILLCGESS